jgi:GT2 family glycosyltransferase
MQATSFILAYRASGDPERHANLLTVLAWLRTLPLAEVIVVEQDIAATLGSLPAVPGQRHVFAYNPGAFNKGWAYNIGARLAGGSLLAFGDADTLTRSLPAAVAACRAGVPVLRAFTGLIDLDEKHSAWLREDLSCLSDPSFAADLPADRRALGEQLPLCSGLVLFQPAYFKLLGGWDERFLGWGGEDDAMALKVRRAQLPALVLPQADGYHLHHRRTSTAQAAQPDYARNLALLQQLQTLPEDRLMRLCEVSWQQCGHREMHRPIERPIQRQIERQTERPTQGQP